MLAAACELAVEEDARALRLLLQGHELEAAALLCSVADCHVEEEDAMQVHEMIGRRLEQVLHWVWGVGCGVRRVVCGGWGCGAVCMRARVEIHTRTHSLSHVHAPRSGWQCVGVYVRASEATRARARARSHIRNLFARTPLCTQARAYVCINTRACVFMHTRTCTLLVSHAQGLWVRV